MTDQSPAAPRAITLVEMNGRIEELEAQRNGALRRCAVLAGERAEALDLLRQCQVEIARLTGIIDANAPPAAPGEAASSALN